MEKPMIGIIPLVDMERESYWMHPGYMKGVEQAGGIPVMLPLTSDEKDLQQAAEGMDGFLFTGGQDISPNMYAQEYSPLCGKCCRERDEMEAVLFRMVYELDKPVLGICRGIQYINVIMGGTLYQDLPSEHPSHTEHHQTPPYDVPIHQVKILEQSPLYNTLKKERIMVNSYHHQAIRILAPKLSVMAISDDDLVEAVCVPKKRFIWGIQWHPELSYLSDENSGKIFAAFIAAAGGC
ncbi:MAG: gamma-glutamyl-gamma-aminobutyrate hydrolase family protein [Muribaculum sp.]|nr:gamma-glutamyl-gamma-aminobutyrate hydrolase family protein [Muribaculum sp.]